MTIKRRKTTKSGMTNLKQVPLRQAQGKLAAGSYGVVVIPVGWAGVERPGSTVNTPDVASMWKMDTVLELLLSTYKYEPDGSMLMDKGAVGKLNGLPIEVSEPSALMENPAIADEVAT